MRFYKKLFPFIILLFLFASCSLQKRNYLRGYHIEWKNSSASTNKNTASYKKVSKNNSTPDLPAVEVKVPSSEVAKNNYTASSTEQAPKTIYTGLKTFLDNCDTIVLRDGTEIKAKVLEITPHEVKYKYCNNPDGPTIVIVKNEVDFIKYSNGEKEYFKKTINDVLSSQVITREEDDIRKDSNRALLFGILAFVTSFFGVLFAIGAIIRGTRAQRNMERNPAYIMRYRNNARAGVILGVIALCLIVAIFAYIFLR